MSQYTLEIDDPWIVLVMDYINGYITINDVPNKAQFISALIYYDVLNGAEIIERIESIYNGEEILYGNKMFDYLFLGKEQRELIRYTTPEGLIDNIKNDLADNLDRISMTSDIYNNYCINNNYYNVGDIKDFGKNVSVYTGIAIMNDDVAEFYTEYIVKVGNYNMFISNAYIYISGDTVKFISHLEEKSLLKHIKDSEHQNIEVNLTLKDFMVLYDITWTNMCIYVNLRNTWHNPMTIVESLIKPSEELKGVFEKLNIIHTNTFDGEEIPNVGNILENVPYQRD
jgi:hypothetical protein